MPKKSNNLISYNKIKKWLLNKGYLRVEEVFEKGDFSIKGNIIDVYPHKLANPLRFEYNNDNLESIRVYSLKSLETKIVYKK